MNLWYNIAFLTHNNSKNQLKMKFGIFININGYGGKSR